MTSDSPDSAELGRADANSRSLPKSEAIERLTSGMRSVRDELARLLAVLEGLLGAPDGQPDVEDALFERLLERCRERLAQTRQELFEAELDKNLLHEELAKRERHAAGQEARIAALEERAAELEARLREQEERTPIVPSHLGSALGDAVDEIQKALSGLDNPLIDYGLRELDLESQVNLAVGGDQKLRLRFPGLNEKVDPHQLSRLSLRLCPIPKSLTSPDGGAIVGDRPVGPGDVGAGPEARAAQDE